MAFDGWLYRAALVIDYTKGIDADLTDWTLVFDQTFGSLLTQADGPMDADGACPSLNGGGDIRFSSDAAGATRLACDIRTWATNNTPASATCEVAVKIPSVSSAANTTIYMWWGKTGETQPSVSDTYGQYNAYDSYYEAVWPDGGGTSQRKSASYTGTAVGSPTAGGVAGKVGGATQYSRALVQYYSLSGMPIGSKRASTIEANAKAKIPSSGAQGMNFYDERDADDQDPLPACIYYYQDLTTWDTRAIIRDSEGISNSVKDTTTVDDTWYHVSSTYDGSNTIKLYTNGVLKGTDSTNTIGDINGIDRAYLGANAALPDTWCYNGLLDELRLSRTVRSAEWLKANYNNQFKTSGFLAFGTITSEVYGTGIASEEAFGTATVANATSGQNLTPSGIASAEAFGTAALTVGAVSITPASIESTEAFGTATVQPGTKTVEPASIASAEAFGTAALTVGAVSITPSGVASAEAFGTAAIQTGAVSVTPAGIASAEAFGTAILQPGIVSSGIASAEAFGTATITTGNVNLTPSGIASAEAFGTAALTLGAVSITPSGIASSEAFGTASVSIGAVSLAPGGIASAEAFGTATLTTGAVSITPAGISSAEDFGTATVSQGLVLYPAGIASAEAFGSAVLTTGSVSIAPSSISSAEAFGTASVQSVISPSGIASAEAFGTAALTVGTANILPSGIASAEAFGTATITGGAVARKGANRRRLRIPPPEPEKEKKDGIAYPGPIYMMLTMNPATATGGAAVTAGTIRIKLLGGSASAMGGATVKAPLIKAGVPQWLAEKEDEALAKTGSILDVDL